MANKRIQPRTYQLKRGEDYYIRVLLQETRLKDIMTTEVVCIKVAAPFRDVPRLMNEYHIRHLPVVDNEGKLAGLMTQRDLFKVQPPKKLLDGEWHYDQQELDRVILSHVMVRDPFCLREEDTMGQALLAMVRHKYGCIPVVDPKGLLKGIMTQMDILNVAAQILNE